jgi:hypothetical protein
MAVGGTMTPVYTQELHVPPVRATGIQDTIVPSIEELNSMTLQIGLVGVDGLVLASDRLVQQYESGSRSVSIVSKFLQGAGVLCCYSGDYISEQSAYGIQKHEWTAMSSRDKETTRSVLIGIGNEAATKAETKDGTLSNCARKVLAALYGEQLWLLEPGGQNTSIANQVLDRAVAGDTENTCRYFINKYANDCYCTPVDKLIRLAAYTVLAAGEENPHGVRGLEIYVIPLGGSPILLGTAQELELAAWFKETAGLIQKKLTRSFTY